MKMNTSAQSFRVHNESLCRTGPRQPGRENTRRRAGFTLTEVLIATSILGLSMAMTMTVVVAAMKRAQHTEQGLQGTTELRRAADFISQAVRTAARMPTVSADGLTLTLPPRDLGYAVVLETTYIDTVHDVKGSKSTMQMLHIGDATLPLVLADVWAGNDRPAGAISAADMTKYFKTFDDLVAAPENKELGDMFKEGDTIVIPATSYGASVSKVIKSISNGKGKKTLTTTDKLGVDVPNGTKIAATTAHSMMFQVVKTGTNAGELRYYPNKDETSKFSVLARDIDPSPLSDPSKTTSLATLPFAISATASNYVTVTLQKIPAGTMVGRTFQGVRTTVFTRNDPTIP